jgi:N-acetyl-anhydromuramyl-L-alanine amidase AmpD
MGRLLWLVDKLRQAGLDVEECSGWQQRGSYDFNPQGLVCHHTAGSPNGDYPSLNIVTNGRPGLPGPLAQLGLGRSGKVYVIASGRANHAGSGGWRGLSGNSSVIGIEAENTGRGEPWPQVQLDAYLRTAAVVCRHGGFGPAMVCGHKEWAPDRKIDPNGIDMHRFRVQIAELLGDPRPNRCLEAHVILRVGDRGEPVRHMQRLLIANGHDLSREGGLDGIFGQGTQQELRAYQTHRPNECGAADGICGPRTWASLHRITNQVI